MPCVSEHQVLALVGGRLEGSTLAEVERHVEQCETCRAIVVEVAEPDRSRAIRAPTRIGRYEILEPIAAGQMGVVYSARDPQLGRTVALKLLRRGSAAAVPGESSASTAREAQAMAGLSHPAVVAVHDAGIHEDQRYIVMERIEGGTLRQWLAERPRGWKEILTALLTAGRGLAAAHAAGIVHRDFKPDNVLVGTDGRVRVTDFGLAQLASATLPTQPPDPTRPARSTTSTGTIAGSPAYMAPEVCRGAPADARSDLFSFCATAYEALYGILPFAGRTLEELAKSVELGELRRPLRKGAPSRIRHLLARGLAARREERPRSLDSLLDSMADSLRPVGRRAAALAAAVAALLGAVLLATRAREPARMTLAVADFVNDTHDDDLNALSGLLITALEQSPRFSVISRWRMVDILRQMGRSDVERIDEGLAREVSKRAHVDALVVSSIQRFGEFYAIDLKVLDPARGTYVFAAKQEGRGKETIPALIDKLSELTRAGLRGRASDTGAADAPVAQTTTANLAAYQHFFRAEELLSRDDFPRAEQELRRAVALDGDFALGRLWLAFVLAWDHRSEYAKELERALQLRERLPEPKRCAADALVALQRDFAEGNAKAKECAARFPEEKMSLLQFVETTFHRGELTSAAAYFERLQSLDPGFAAARDHQFATWQMLGRFDKMMALAESYRARDHNDRAYAYLAHTHMAAGNWERARAVLREAELLFPESPLPGLQRILPTLLAGEAAEAEAGFARLPWRERLDKTTWVGSPGHTGLVREKDPGRPEERRHARTVLDEYQGRYRKAMAEIDRQLVEARKTGFPRDVEWPIHQKVILLVLGYHDVAAARKAEEEMPADAPWLTDLCLLQGDVERADSLPPATLNLLPGGEDRVAADRLRKSGRISEAIPLYEKLAATHAIPRVYEWLYTLAELYLQTGQPLKAVASLRRLQSTFPQRLWWQPGGQVFVHRFSSSFHLLGQAYEQSGDTSAALQAYQRFLRIWSDADPELEELVHARQRTAALTARSQR